MRRHGGGWEMSITDERLKELRERAVRWLECGEPGRLMLSAATATALIDELLSLRRSQWRPIETVPEGERVLVAYKFHGVYRPSQVDIKEWCDGGFIWPSRYYESVAWMPLPPPPKDSV